MKFRTLTLAVLAAGALSGSADAASKADLSVSKGSASGATIAPGGQLTINWTVKNGGGGAAGKSVLDVVLSKDAKLDKSDTKLGSASVKAIKARKSLSGKLTAKVNAPAGRYTLLVCADAKAKVKETSEKNNCRAAGTLTVSAPTTGGGTTPGGPVATPAPAPATPQPTASPLPTASAQPTATATNSPAPDPDFAITIGGPGTTTNGANTFTLAANRTGATFECRLDDAAFAPCGASKSYTGVLAGEHHFEVTAKAGTLAATAAKTWLIEFEAPAPGPTPQPAPAPETKASTASVGEVTLVSDTTKFLYTGTDPIQKQVATNAIDAERAAVLRGVVRRRNGSPIDGVQVTVVDQPSLGRTATRTDGGFEIAVNGGSSVTLEFEREGYVPSQRQLEVPTQEFERVEEIVMVPYEDRVTGIDLTDDELQVARGSSVTDGSGTRQATLLLEPGTEATATLPDGTQKELGDKLNIRATEFTIGESGPAAMPGELPPTSAYTYAVEYSVDEANKDQAVDVQFDKPIVTYVDNVVGFPAGTAVPMGYYDREQGQWVAAKDGVVIKILSETGGRAQLDVTGDGAADTGAALTKYGIDDDELKKLADLYAPGKSLWRAAITHFTPWDYNWPYGLPDGADGPGQGGPDGGDPDGDDPCGQGGSIILCENQVLGEQLPIAGTPYTLSYQSDRVAGRRTGDELEIPLTGATPPSSMTRVDLTIEVAGRTIKRSFPRSANLSYTFRYDGLDAYGRATQGRQNVDVDIDYVYPAVYRAPAAFSSSFAAVGGARLSTNSTRTEINVGQRWSGVVGGLQAPASALAGWSIDAHHTYDPVGRTLYLGYGRDRSAEGQNFDVISTTKSGLAAPEGMTATADGALLVADSAAHVVRKVVPGGATTVIAGVGTAGFSGDGGPATEAELNHPADVAIGPDGAIYIADEGNDRVRKLVDGKLTTVAGTGEGGWSGNGGPATAAELDEPSDVAVDAGGTLYIVDRANHAVRRVGPDGIISALAGNGAPGFAGDGGVSTRARLRSPADVAVRESDGSVFIADGGNNRVRRIDPDGTIETVAGDGEEAYRGDGGKATAASLDTPSAVLPLRDGGLLVADAGNATLRKVGSDRTIATVAGNGNPGIRGDGGPAAQARIDFPQAVVLGPDDTIYLADEGNNRIRELAPSLPGLSVGEFTIAAEDGRSLYVFDRSGRHLRTVDALTKAVLLKFGYDLSGRLTTIEDADANKTTIQRTAAGAPTAIVGPDGQTTTLEVDAAGYLKTIDYAGDRYTAEYAAGGLLSKLTDPRAGVHRFEYDTAGRLTKDVAADGSEQTLARSVAGGVTTVVHKTGEGRPTTYRVERTANGAVQRTVTDGEGRKTTTVTGNDGVTTVTHPDGTKVSAEVGPDPRFGMQAPIAQRMTITTPGGRRSTIEAARTTDLADPGNALSLRSLTDTVTVNGRTHTTRFDAATRRFVDASPTGRTTTTDISPQGRAVRVEIPTLAPTTFAYDARGRLSRSTQGLRIETFAYDDKGRVASVSDARSRTTKFTYDLADRPATVERPDGRVTAFTYDRAGNLTSLAPPGKAAHTFSYSSRNVLEKSIAPGAATTNYTADRDSLVTGVIRPGGSALGFSYDLAGRLKQITQPRGTTTYSYGSANGLLAGVTGPGGTESVAYTYDGALPLTTTIAGTVAGQVSATYDDDLRVKTTSVNGANTVTNEFDDDGLLMKAGALTIVNDPEGLLLGTTLANTATLYNRNPLGELESATARYLSTVKYGETYSRDVNGRIMGKTESRGGTATSYVYAYDPADRLQQVTRDGVVTATYTYDSNGNRKTVTRNGDALPTTGDYDAQDRLTAYGGFTYTYADSGELTSKAGPGGTTSYVYDAQAALTRVTLPGKQIEYAIDPAGRRVAVKHDGTLVRGFLYGGGLGPVAELKPDGTLLSRFVYATRSNVPDYMVRDGKTYRIITDQLGSPRAVIDTGTGVVEQELDYDEFGRVTRDTKPGFQPFGFGGGLYDSDTKLVRFGARDYDPETGRFTTKDPLGFGGGDANLYGYALGDPQNLVDPTGQILDTIADIAFIGYDLYQIGSSLLNGCGVSGTDLLALGADVAGAIIPFATGGGMAVRGANAAADAARYAPPVGSRRAPIEIQPGTNAPTNIGGRDYSGHAVDRMQGRGIPPSVVDDAISHGQVTRSGDTTIHYSPDNNVSVVVNSDGRVVTVGYGQFRPRP